LVSAIYFYQLKKLNLIPNRPLPIYLGASLESGKVWGDTNLSHERFIESASVFIGADSLLGPIYLAFGATDTGRKAAHLMIRPAFK
jgi:NTE family protein